MQHPKALEAIKNDEWISDEQTPDPSPLPGVVGWTLLVRPVAIRRRTKGGILLPDQVKDDIAYLTTVGRVLAMGPLAYDKPDMYVNGVRKPWCRVGDYVSYGKFSGKRVAYKGVKLLLLNDDHVLMVVDKPEFLDPMIGAMG